MFSWTSPNPAAVVLWHQDQLLVLLPMQAQHPVQECKADNRTALTLMGKESPQCWCSCGAVNYSLGGELRGWIAAPEGIACMEQHCQAQAPADLLCWELQDVLGSCSRWSGGARSCLKPSISRKCLSISDTIWAHWSIFILNLQSDNFQVGFWKQHTE